jgi:hypothetical protein
MIKVQIYIEDELIDLFGDENISITSTIQDIKDAGSVFTDFSQSFSVPASSTNNQVFGHFYNNKIIQGGYDTRNKKRAKIFINHIEFRKGYIMLNGVKMNNNKPSSYDITFFGSTVRLKDLFKDDDLNALCDINKTNNLSNYNHPYNSTKVKEGFTTGLDFTVNSQSKTDAIIYPLITPEKRLFFNSTIGGSDPANFSGNVYSVGSDTTRGVAYEDLKPAIKMIHIIEAIEGHYGIEFTRDFFDTEAFTNLYMWLSSASGNIPNYKLRGAETEIIRITGIANPDNSVLKPYSISDNDTIDFTVPENRFQTKAGFITARLRITPISSDLSKTYTIKSIDTITGNVIREQTGSGVQTLVDKYNFSQKISSRDYSIKYVVETSVNITFTAELQLGVTTGGAPQVFLTDDSYIAVNGGSNFSTIPEITLEHHLPQIKVIDFLSGVFKMFNLVAFFIDDETDDDFGKIKVMSLDSFYADATNNPTKGIVDINKYVDITEHYVAASLPYATISFKYQETDVVLMEQHTLDHNEVFGNSEYTPDDFTDYGKKYEIELPFSHLKYEHLLDEGNDLAETSILYGYVAGGNFNADDGNYSSQDIDPLVFYGINETIPSSTTYINWISDTEDAIATYWRPSNSNESTDKTTPADFTINFDAEVDEFYLTDYPIGDEETGFEQQAASNSLFKKFYSKYIISSLDPTKRIIKLTAYFPASLMVRYRLNDQFKIQDEMYRINSITTNINTGKTELELLTLNENEIV